ncbi:hypothetical protein AAG906_028459 [Vitis piasezkii]
MFGLCVPAGFGGWGDSIIRRRLVQNGVVPHSINALSRCMLLITGLGKDMYLGHAVGFNAAIFTFQ